jgi:hypothetical protein
MLILTNEKDGNATTHLHAIPYGVSTEIVEFEAEKPNDAAQFSLMMHLTDGASVSLGSYPDDASMKAALTKIDKVVDFTYYPNPKK